MTFRGSLPSGQAFNNLDLQRDPQPPYHQQMYPNGVQHPRPAAPYADARFTVQPTPPSQPAQPYAQYPQYAHHDMMNNPAMPMNGMTGYAPYGNVGYHQNQQLPPITQPPPQYHQHQQQHQNQHQNQLQFQLQHQHQHQYQHPQLQPQPPPHPQQQQQFAPAPHPQQGYQSARPYPPPPPHQQPQYSPPPPQTRPVYNTQNVPPMQSQWKGPPSRPAVKMSQPAPQPVPQPIPQLAPQPIPPPVPQPVPQPAHQPAYLPNESKTPAPKPIRMPPPTTTPSVSASTPTLTHMSPSMTARRSPSVASSKSGSLIDTTPLLLGVADECIEKAREAAPWFQSSINAGQVEEYQALIATGLSCLETVLQTGRLTPKQEALARLRYAAVLFEETENYMEAETALSKGITLCEKHQYLDLKYCMNYLLVTVAFQRSRKAGMRALDGLVHDATVFRHYHWVYAFRLLRANFFARCGNDADQAALNNLTETANLASQVGDYGVTMLCCVLQGLALIKSMKPNSVELVQQSIAQAAKHQHEPTAQNSTLSILLLLLDLMCSMHQKETNAAAQKAKTLQLRLDSTLGEELSRAIHIPIKKSPNEANTISADTAAILRPAAAGEDFDYLVVSSLNKLELYSLVHTFDSVIHINKEPDRSTPTGGYKTMRNWEEGLKLLNADPKVIRAQGPKSLPLHESIRRTRWRVELTCYLHALKALFYSTRRQWDQVKESISKIDDLAKTWVSPDSDLAVLYRYVTGAYHQGMGNLSTALEIFEHEGFSLDGKPLARPRLDICLLAGFNRLWIMQHPSHKDAQAQYELFERIKSACSQHPDREIQAVLNLAQVTLPNPEETIQSVKHSVHAAIKASGAASNALCTAISLCVLHQRLFEGMVGEQAFKSAQAASAQSQRGGNPLWQCVADGILSQAYEVQGQLELAKTVRSKSVQLASELVQSTNMD